MQIKVLLIYHILSVRLASIQILQKYFFFSPETMGNKNSYIFVGKTKQYNLMTGNLAKYITHVPFYTDISFQEIYTKIHWHKFKNTYTQVYVLQ